MTTHLDADTQNDLARLTRNSLAKLLDQAQRTAALLDDLERQAAERRHGPEAWDTQRDAVHCLATAIDAAVAEFARADPALFCPCGHPDVAGCAEGAHDD